MLCISNGTSPFLRRRCEARRDERKFDFWRESSENFIRKSGIFPVESREGEAKLGDLGVLFWGFLSFLSREETGYSLLRNWACAFKDFLLKEGESGKS